MANLAQVEVLVAPGMGANYAAGKAYLYYAGTTTLVTNVYTDAAGTTPAANPITLDANGAATVYCNERLRIDVKNSAGTSAPGFPIDNIGYGMYRNLTWIDVASYGPKTLATINTVLTQVGSSIATLYFETGTWTISDNLTIPSTVTMQVDSGAVFSIASSKTLTINGPYIAPLVKCFDGAGSVVLASGNTINTSQVWFGSADTTSPIGFNVTQISAPTAPTVAVNTTAGNLNGATTYAVSFVTAYGETEVSGDSASVNPSNQQVDLTNIAVSSNAAVIARNIYRVAVGSESSVLKKLVATIADNTTTTYTDNIADGSLGAAAPRINTTGGAIYHGSVRVAALAGLSTAIGTNCLPGNLGYSNYAFGANAMYSNTTGYRNCAYGAYSLFTNTTGARNVGFGIHTLNDNETGDDNVAIGYGALFNTTTDAQTAVGANALTTCTTGTANTAVGYDSLKLALDGSNNTAVGKDTLKAVTAGNSNVAVGNSAAYKITTGDLNVAIGQLAAGSLTEGNNNMAFGTNALYSCVTGIQNVAIGNYAGYYETGSNALYIDNAQRASEADGKVKALIYGGFGAAAANQFFTINGLLKLGYVPNYADNAAAKAGGLVDGDVYRVTGAGTLMVVYT